MEFERKHEEDIPKKQGVTTSDGDENLFVYDVFYDTPINGMDFFTEKMEVIDE